MRMRMLGGAAGLLIVGAVSAQVDLNRSEEEEVITIITDVGGTCERVARTQLIGQIDRRDSLLAVACTGGEQYVILVDRRSRMSFYSTCEALAEANNNLVRCFQ